MELRDIAKYYYGRKDIQKAIVENAQHREVVPRYGEGFGKRPDIIEFPADVQNLAEKGATSFHFSEELWNNPLELSTDLSPEKLNELRKGWDLILDIDSKFIGFSKIAAELVIGALKFHNLKNVGVKFSGRGGWHIMVPFEAFPKTVHNIDAKNLFPEGPRIIAGYLSDLIENSLRERLLESTTPKELSARIGKPIEDFFLKERFNPFSIVNIDTVAISPRHLIRMPYSLNEKSSLASIVIDPNQIKNFHLGWAKPNRVFPRPFFPTPEPDEAKELIMQAFDWNKMQESKKKAKDYLLDGPDRPKMRRDFTIGVKNVSPQLWPPCMHNIMQGVKTDGRKRSLFILMNFLRSINTEEAELKQKLTEWNKKNAKPLKEGYILAQLSWHRKNKVMLPPNCEKIQTMYRELGICSPDGFCSKIKNPANYTLLKYRINSEQSGGKKGKSKKKIGIGQKQNGSEDNSKQGLSGTREYRGAV